jgi:hypothetical protein
MVGYRVIQGNTESANSTLNIIRDKSNTETLTETLGQSFMALNEKDRLLGKSLTIPTAEVSILASQEPDISARGYFAIKQFQTEERDEKLLGLKGESINGKAGIWCQEDYVVPIPIEKQAEFVNKCNINLKNIEEDNEKKLKEVHARGVKALSESKRFKFEDRYQPKNISRWLNLLETTTDAQGESYKDWDVMINEKGTPVLKPQNAPKFEIEIINEKDIEKKRNFDDISDKKLVTKVYLVINNDFEIIKIEALYNHFTADKARSTKIHNAIFTGVETVKPPSESTTILRETKIAGENEFTSFDIKHDFELTKEEEEIIDRARKLVSPPLSKSAYCNLAWMLMEKITSSYVCITPTIPRKGDPFPPPGLQIGLLPEPIELTRIMDTLSEKKHIAGWLYKKINITDLRTLFLPEAAATSIDPGDVIMARHRDIKESIKKYADFAQKEYGRCGEGRGLTGVLGAYLPEGLKRIMRFDLFKNQNDFIAQGQMQSSFVTHSNESEKNTVFTTALNLFCKSAIACITYKPNKNEKHSRYSIRLRTDREINEGNLEVFRHLDKVANENQDEETLNELEEATHRDMAKIYIKNKALRYREYLMTLAFLIAESDEGTIDIKRKEEFKNRVNNQLILIPTE